VSTRIAAVCTAVTDRWGGVSRPPYHEFNLAGHVGDDPAAVAENRRRLADRLGARPGRFVWMAQPHGAAVATVDAAPDGPVPAVDALVTTRPGLWLAVLAADCLPVLLADPAAGVVAAAHAGWRGLRAGVLPAALAAMEAAGAQTRRVQARLGPAIGPCCYEVGEDVAAEVTAAVPAAAARTRAGRPALDLPGGAAAQLTAAGVGEVRSAGTCTAESPDLYSYRRDGRTGRFAGLISVAPEP
jgi:YfiH family protein